MMGAWWDYVWVCDEMAESLKMKMMTLMKMMMRLERTKMKMTV
jgi:hypothetical protein